MKDIRIEGRTERCFILKDDQAATVVIPISKLMPVDFRRLRDIENKGGEMLSKMRDETLDNGRNAIKQYEPLFTIVRKESIGKTKEEETKDVFDPRSKKEGQTTKQRGPGRPKSSTAKQSSKKTASKGGEI